MPTINGLIRSWKKRILSITVLFGLFLSACQPTPKETVVLEKNESRFESLIHEEGSTECNDALPSSNEDSKEEGASDCATDQLQKTQYCSFSKKDSFFGADSEVAIEVNVSGDYPINNNTVIKVKPKRYTTEELRNWAKVFSIDGIYLEPKHESTKAEIEKRILDYRRFMTDEKDLAELDSKERQAYLQECEEIISKLEKKYQEAPEIIVRKDCDWEFHDTAYYSMDPDLDEFYDVTPDIDEKLIVDINRENSYGRLLSNYMVTDGVYTSSFHYETYSDIDEYGNVSWNTALEKPLTISVEEAIKKADTLLEQMGLIGRKCSTVRCFGASINGEIKKRSQIKDPSQQVYLYNLVYHRFFDDIELLPTIGLNVSNTSEYGAQYPHEQLNLWVINDEVFLLHWEAPLEIVEVESQSVPVISFETSYDLFKSQMQIEYTRGKVSRLNPEDDSYNDNLAVIKGAEIHVDKALFGLVRIQIPNNYEMFRLVPVWSYRGGELLDYGNGCDWDNSIVQKEIYQTINAVDGTFIDVWKGY